MTIRNGRQRPLGSIVYHMADDNAGRHARYVINILRGWVGATSEIYADVNVLTVVRELQDIEFKY